MPVTRRKVVLGLGVALAGPSAAGHSVSNRLLVAHRGFGAQGAFNSVAPENTMIAFQRAVALGSYVLETDVRVSEDGIALLMHDETVDRTTNGTGRVANLSYSYLSTLEAGLKFRTPMKGIRIPTLKEYFSFCKAQRAFALPEIKGVRAKSDITLLLKEMQESDMVRHTIWSSFRMTDLEHVRKFGIKDCGIALIAQSADYLPSFYELEGDKVFMPEVGSLLQNLNWITECASKKVRVWPWTIDSARVANYLLDAGCDMILSNGPL